MMKLKLKKNINLNLKLMKRGKKKAIASHK